MPFIFGTRHHSPGASRELWALCESLRPDMILIEAPSDAPELFVELVSDAIPPAAILAYTEQEPLRSQRLPLAYYSPEYTAVRWALKHGAVVEAIDLPFAVTLALPTSGGEDDGGESPYDLCARAAGDGDFDTFWESRFESLRNGFVEATLELGETLRVLEPPTPETLIREAFMRRRITAAQDAHASVLVVCGAYHAPALSQGLLMSDAEYAALPRVPCKLTLMPYSYEKLSISGGYGAGVAAPNYNEMLYRHGDEAAAAFMSGVAAHMRELGVFRSPAEAADAVSLARALGSVRGRGPVLADLRDAARAALGRDEPDAVARALSHVEIGTSVGSLPKGLRHNPVQDDFHRQIRALRLDRYLSAAETELALDLRTDATNLSLDRRRSVFFHRLRVLSVPFAQHSNASRTQADWKELWTLRWSPETELALADASQHGVRVQDAALSVLRNDVVHPKTSAILAEALEQALLCDLPELFSEACAALRDGLSDDFADTVSVIETLDRILRYGSPRAAETEALPPLLEKLSLRACLDLPRQCRCADAESGMVLRRFQSLASIFTAREPPSAWGKSVAEIAHSLETHPKLSGYAFALCPDSVETLSRELSRRLSPALPPGHGAAWLEGFISRNRSALWTRLEFWAALDDYISSLDETRFRVALVGFRRVFSILTPQEKRAASEQLYALWAEYPTDENPPDGELTAQEIEALEALRDFHSWH